MGMMTASDQLHASADPARIMRLSTSTPATAAFLPSYFSPLVYLIGVSAFVVVGEGPMRRRLWR
jgi:hypothetical protein